MKQRLIIVFSTLFLIISNKSYALDTDAMTFQGAESIPKPVAVEYLNSLLKYAETSDLKEKSISYSVDDFHDKSKLQFLAGNHAIYKNGFSSCLFGEKETSLLILKTKRSADMTNMNIPSHEKITTDIFVGNGPISNQHSFALILKANPDIYQYQDQVIIQSLYLIDKNGNLIDGKKHISKDLVNQFFYNAHCTLNFPSGTLTKPIIKKIGAALVSLGFENHGLFDTAN